MADRDDLPRLSAGRLEVVLACPRRLAATLSRDGAPSRSSDGPFRLPNAVTDALRAAWLDPANRPLRLDPTPPPALSLEEAHRFRAAMDAYAEAVGDRPLALDPRSGQILSARSADGTHLVTGRPDLLLRRADGDLEVHRVMPGPPPGRRPGAPSTSDVALAALVRRGGAAGVRVHVVRLWTEPPGDCVEHTVGADEVDALRARLRAAVAGAVDDPVAVPGWCCRDCPLLRRCDAVPSLPWEQVVGTTAPAALGAD